MLAQPDRVPETAQSYVNFVLGLSADLPSLLEERRGSQNKSAHSPFHVYPFTGTDHCRPVKQAVSADKGMILNAVLAI
jgi:hypothetical protein